MPATFKIDIEKRMNNEYWSNVYYVNNPDMVDAKAVALQIVGFERTITRPAVTFTKVRVTDLAPGSEDYSIMTVNLGGQRGGTSDMLPLFVVARADMGAELGRPSRKFLRGSLAEGDVTFDTYHPDYTSAFNTGYAVPLQGLTTLCDIDGDDIITVSLYSAPAMRQLRRGSKRRSQPIIP